MRQPGSETLPFKTGAENPSVPAAAHRYKHTSTSHLCSASKTLAQNVIPALTLSVLGSFQGTVLHLTPSFYFFVYSLKDRGKYVYSYCPTNVCIFNMADAF